MKAIDLIEKLQALPPNTEIQVYGHASVTTEKEFMLVYDANSDLVRLTPPWYKG